MGGFGGMVLSDLHLLLPTAASKSEGDSGSSSRGGGSRGVSGFRWVQPKVSGQPPLAKYAHSLSRCGPAGDLAVVFGGLMAGG